MSALKDFTSPLSTTNFSQKFMDTSTLTLLDGSLDNLHLPSLIEIKNGQKVQPTFSHQEYANRHEKLREYLDNHSIVAALFTSIHNINYYSDFMYCSFGRPYGLVVTSQEVVSI